MSDPQLCVGGHYHFDLAELPAERIERNRAFGMTVSLFALPFVALLLLGCIWAFQNEQWIFLGIFALFLIVPNLILAWGLTNLLTTVRTTISGETVKVVYERPWGTVSWTEPLRRYKLQIKVTQLRKDDQSLNDTYHIRLAHKNDLQSIELHTSEDLEEIRQQYETYKQQLAVNVDKHIRDFNTDQPIGNAKLLEKRELFGLEKSSD